LTSAQPGTPPSVIVHAVTEFIWGMLDNGELPMKIGFVMITGVLAFLALPLAAQAQGIVEGGERGAAVGGRAGPVRLAGWLVAWSVV